MSLATRVVKNEARHIVVGGDFPRAACNCFKLGPDWTKPGGLTQEVGQEMVQIRLVRLAAGFSDVKVVAVLCCCYLFLLEVKQCISLTK